MKVVVLKDGWVSKTPTENGNPRKKGDTLEIHHKTHLEHLIGAGWVKEAKEEAEKETKVSEPTETKVVEATETKEAREEKVPARKRGPKPKNKAEQE